MHKIPNIETPAAEFVALFASWLAAPALAVAKGSIKPAPRVAPDAVIAYAMHRHGSVVLIANFNLGVRTVAVVSVGHDAAVSIIEVGAEAANQFAGPYGHAVVTMRTRGALLQMAAQIAAGCSAHVAAAVY
jgi:hypothetical protein